MIARAVYKNPEFIFLDEVTNALDANNEREIMKHLHQFYKERTVVIVALALLVGVEMKATAEIVTDDIRLIERFFQPLKKILKEGF